MIPLRFPEVDVPEGWTAADRGPRRWLVPPGGDVGRIVLLPLLPRRKGLSPEKVLEASLAGELQSFAAVNKTPFTDVTGRDGPVGVATEVSLLDGDGTLLERRHDAALADERTVQTLFLQARPEAYDALRGTFLAVAASVRIAR
jgi:hypothetical protein